MRKSKHRSLLQQVGPLHETYDKFTDLSGGTFSQTVQGLTRVDNGGLQPETLADRSLV
eukprot:CAMPEP_0202341200 /NCGR_PEP_ID=MMETSP1126-20121109/2310_1 /ASSEMBLY_ACC=CAM_ASM_000457 /TAXON_ID=3047 /ORGANISM="Dunaliella tertiolecta, Strain CCMP1320" /LENGTH=57 /DNA_ID=CAMNT_0048932009 /DNA_START=2487 /DNA_END=2657 /DNA_ORIENTATION=+